MLEYPKTENLFLRDEDSKKLIIGAFRAPEFDIPKFWHVSEKIDGMNGRVVYDPLGATVDYRGRSDRANMPHDLAHSMAQVFTLDKMQRQFDDFLGADMIESGAKVTIFGECYGPGIQKGGYYGKEKAFRMFDVVYHRPHEVAFPHDALPSWEWRHSWCQPSTVTMIAQQLGAQIPPLIGDALDMAKIVDHVRAYTYPSPSQPMMLPALDEGGQEYMPEGIIARTNPYIFNERGQRIMFKLKVCDV